MKKVKLVLDAQATLGEGPSWDNQNKVLYWVDIMGKNLHIFDPDKNDNRIIYIGQYVGAVVPSYSGYVILALQNGFHSLNLETEELTLITDPESHLPSNRFNDGKCDAAGRFWAGTMSLNESGQKGALYCLENGVARMALNRVTISNGLAWDKDNKTMYFIDTPTKQVVAFDYDLETGTISNKRTVVTIPEGEGHPDGMTIDEEGMLWIAHWDGYQISKWNPNSQAKLEAISLPVARVTSCTFGGEHLDELYITTARIGLDEQNLENQPLAGGLFRIKTETKGTESFRYRG